MKKLIIFIIILAIASVVFVEMIRPDQEQVTKHKTLVVGEDTPNENWCLKETITGQNGEVIIEEQQGGRYDYELYATSKGIEVWVPCK